MRARVILLSAITLLLSGALISGALLSPAAHAATTSPMIAGGPTSSSDSTSVQLDTELYLPTTSPAPAVLLAHGFGGSKDSVVEEAKALQARGYVVLAWSARGFGKSSGSISMNSPDREVVDVRRLIDYLSTRKEVVQDAKGDPRVGITGGSYGGAISLLAGAQDHRIDAIAADITWNNLEGALFPQSALGVSNSGPFKRVWTGTFFSIGSLSTGSLAAGSLAAGSLGVNGKPASGTLSPTSLLCGRFAPEWCAAYQASVAQSAPSAQITALMKGVSPATYASEILAPTLLMQGEADSLFPLNESTRTAAAIRRSHPATPLAMIWHGGGHDGGQDEGTRLRTQVANWFDIYLKKRVAPFPTFQLTQSAAAISSQDSAPEARVQLGEHLPLDLDFQTLDISHKTQVVLAPAGASPSAISALPGLGSALSLAGGLGAFLPGQSALFLSAPLTAQLPLIGSSHVKVRIASTTGDATLFFSLVIKSESGRVTQPNGLVSPVRLTGIPSTGVEVEISLPAIVANATPGDRLALAVSTTDLGYTMPQDGRIYSITPTSPLNIATFTLRNAPSSTPLYIWPLIALGAFALSLLWVFIRRPRHPAVTAAAKVAGRDREPSAPLVSVRKLNKEYSDGYKAVTDLSFTVERGQVVGLLGPNGAGKTTTLRMLMGLIFPTSGEIEISGVPVFPGSRALAGLGSFVEGPGFLPHLTGSENLDLYWRSTGRSEDPEIADALEISGLGTAVNKKVRTYSQGMRQRLAIAQAMLGKPELLVLDEPTNGLDPTQIKAMRSILKNYADSGRTVIVSSHLLSEVEQTCSHVVVMHRGLLIASGTIDEILNRNGKRAQHLEEIFMDLVGTDTEIGI